MIRAITCTLSNQVIIFDHPVVFTFTILADPPLKKRRNLKFNKSPQLLVVSDLGLSVVLAGHQIYLLCTVSSCRLLHAVIT